MNLEQLNEIHIDVLKEIGNIGSGNAATALASILGDTVAMDIPKVNIVDVNQAVDALGGPEKITIGVLCKLSEDIEGLMMFLIQQEYAPVILEGIGCPGTKESGPLSEMEKSAISEIGNILISSYINSIATLSKLNIHTSVPALCVDMVGALMSVPAIEMATVSDHIIFIQDSFLSDEQSITANMLLVPNITSLEKILQRLGIKL
jgi:chemotaxis protein CheC